MKNIIPFLAIIFLLTACGDDDDATSNTDLTELAVGVYEDLDGGIFTVNKKDNNTITISYRIYTFTDVAMNSETSFTLNEYSFLDNDQLCVGYVKSKFNGNGTVSENSISLFIIGLPL